jgi:lysophospholipase L1-like esterase
MPEVRPTGIPAQPIPLRHRMRWLSGRLAGVGAIKIVAIGSSTTAGEGDIVPYPQRLERALRASYPGRNFDVLNRGVGGEEAPDEFRRLQSDAIDERPSVVIWQVGTNAVWKNQDLNATAEAIERGLVMFANELMDVVLMDLQFVPAVQTSDTKERASRMVELIERAADRAAFPVNVFHRFDLMRQWHEVERISFDRIVDPTDSDRLHHSDWSARRMAEALASTIAAAAAATA